MSDSLRDILVLIFVGYFLYRLARAPFEIFRAYKCGQTRTTSATGIVRDVRLGKLHWGTNVPKPVVEFIDGNGQTHEFHSSMGASWNPWPVGSRVEVFYNPEDPKNAEIQATRGMIVFGIVVFTVVFGAINFYVAMKAWVQFGPH